MNNKLEDLFKHHVDSHESKVDPNSIWEGIQKKRQRPKRKKFFYLLPLFFMLFLSGYYFLNSFDALENQQVTVTETVSRIENTIRPALESESNQGANFRTNKAAKKLEASTTSFDISKRENSTTSQSNNTSYPEINKKTISTSKTTPTQNIIKKYTQSYIGNNHIGPTSINAAAEKEQTNDAIKIEPFELIDGLNFLETQLHFLIIEPERPSFDNQIVPLKRKRNPIRFSLEFAATQLSKKLNTVDPILVSVAEEKQKIENPLDSYSGRLLVDIPILSNFSVEFGIDFTRMYEQIIWDGSYMINENGEIFPIDGYNEIGTPLFNYTTGVYFEEVNKNIDYYNKYNVISIPLALAYNVAWNQRIGASFSAGVNINAYESFHGYLYTEDNVPLRLEESSDFLSFSSAPFAKARLTYPLYRNIHLSGGLEYTFRKMTERTTSWNYSSFGINLGLSLSL